MNGSAIRLPIFPILTFVLAGSPGIASPTESHVACPAASRTARLVSRRAGDRVGAAFVQLSGHGPASGQQVASGFGGGGGVRTNAGGRRRGRKCD